MTSTIGSLINCVPTVVGCFASYLVPLVTGSCGTIAGGISSYLFSGCGGIIESVLDAMGSF